MGFHARCKAGCLSVAMATATSWYRPFCSLHHLVEVPSSAVRVTLGSAEPLLSWRESSCILSVGGAFTDDGSARFETKSSRSFHQRLFNPADLMHPGIFLSAFYVLPSQILRLPLPPFPSIPGPPTPEDVPIRPAGRRIVVPPGGRSNITSLS